MAEEKWIKLKLSKDDGHFHYRAPWTCTERTSWELKRNEMKDWSSWFKFHNRSITSAKVDDVLVLRGSFLEDTDPFGPGV